jgi:hypothetical protein
VARRFARLAGLRFVASSSQGLAAWTVTALPAARAITVQLPPRRAGRGTASRLAYAVDRLAGTRFARGARADRRRMIAAGLDPRAQR